MYQREKAFLIKTAYLAAVLAVGWLILRYALVWLLPFLLALGFAALMEPAITLARRKLRLQRGFLAAVLTLALLALVIALGAGLGIWGGINLLEGYGNDNPGANAHVR